MPWYLKVVAQIVIQNRHLTEGEKKDLIDEFEKLNQKFSKIVYNTDKLELNAALHFINNFSKRLELFHSKTLMKKMFRDSFIASFIIALKISNERDIFLSDLLPVINEEANLLREKVSAKYYQDFIYLISKNTNPMPSFEEFKNRIFDLNKPENEKYKSLFLKIEEIFNYPTSKNANQFSLLLSQFKSELEILKLNLDKIIEGKHTNDDIKLLNQQCDDLIFQLKPLKSSGFIDHHILFEMEEAAKAIQFAIENISLEFEDIETLTIRRKCINKFIVFYPLLNVDNLDIHAIYALVSSLPYLKAIENEHAELLDFNFSMPISSNIINHYFDVNAINAINDILNEVNQNKEFYLDDELQSFIAILKMAWLRKKLTITLEIANKLKLNEEHCLIFRTLKALAESGDDSELRFNDIIDLIKKIYTTSIKQPLLGKTIWSLSTAALISNINADTKNYHPIRLLGLVLKQIYQIFPDTLNPQVSNSVFAIRNLPYLYKYRNSSQQEEFLVDEKTDSLSQSKDRVMQDKEKLKSHQAPFRLRA